MEATWLDALNAIISFLFVNWGWNISTVLCFIPWLIFFAVSILFIVGLAVICKFLITDCLCFPIKKITKTICKKKIGDLENNPDNQEASMEEGNFTVRENSIKSKIQKFCNATMKELEGLPVDSKEYKGYSNLFACYSNLLQSEVKTISDIDTLEFLFNDGKLRTENELKEWDKQQKHKEYIESGAFAGSLYRYADKYTDTTNILLSVLAIFPYIAAWIIFFVAEGNSIPYTIVSFFEIPIFFIDSLIFIGLYAISAVGILIIVVPVFGVSMSMIQDAVNKCYKKAGIEKPKGNHDKLINTAIYITAVKSLLR